MGGGETAGDDEARAIELELAPSREAIARVMSDLESIRARRPDISNDLSNAIGSLQEADELIEDIPISYVPGGGPPFKPEI
jgi:hypothetical protein